MKKSLLFTIALLFSLHQLNAQYFAWAKRAGLWAFDLGYGIGTDNAGNVYISGKYEMHGASFGTATVGCAGNHDIYTAKYNSAGDFQWVRTAGGPGGDYAHCMAVDAAGNSYVAGEIEQTVNFGGGVSLTSNGDNDVFIAKYNTSGTLQWARKMGGGTKSDKALGICLSNNNIYLTGKFEGTANFAGTTLSSSGGRDIFVAMYTTDGVFQWVRKAGGAGDDEGVAVSSDLAGNCYVTGYFSGSANFSNLFLNSKGSADIFVAKYNSSGGLLWTKRAGGAAADYGNGIKVDLNNNVFLTGGFRLQSTFGTYTLNAQGGDADIFTARYDSNGNALWVKKAGGRINDYGRAIACDALSNIYITGNFGFTSTFGTYSLTGVDSNEVYFASYDVNGNFRWALKSGGVADKSDPGRYIEMGLSIATDPAGNVVASGTYRSATTFGATTLKPWDHTDIFITKIIQGPPPKQLRAMLPLITPKDSASFCSGGGVTLKNISDSSRNYQWRHDGLIIAGANSVSYRATVPGKYEVMSINGNDTLVSEPTIVKLTKKIEAKITTPAKVFCKDSNIVLTANEGEDYLYQWKRNGKHITGAGTQIFQPTRTGDYQVKIIQGSCFDWSPLIHIEVKHCNSKDSLKEQNSAPERYSETKEDSVLINIYPNPNNGLFNLEINMQQIHNSAGEVKVEVINSIGQVVYSQTVRCDKGSMTHHIELGSSVPGGIYILHLSMGDNIEKNRLMLVR